MESAILDIEGPVYVADFGGDGTVMLLVHGLGGAHLNWMAVAPQLAAGHRVYALDLPGFGRSPLAGRRSSITANVDLLTRAITRLSRRPIVLVGNSMGGLLSIGAAARHPSLIDALVLVDPAVPAPRGAFPPRLDRVSRTFLATAFMPRWGAQRLSRAVATRGAENLVRETMRLVTTDPTGIDEAVMEAHIGLETERLAESELERVLLCGNAFAGRDARAEASRVPMGAGRPGPDPAPPGCGGSPRPGRLGAEHRIAAPRLGVPRVRERRARAHARGAR